MKTPQEWLLSRPEMVLCIGTDQIKAIQDDVRTHYESALKEAKYSLDACHAHTVHGEVMTREECHLCKTLATINKVLETK